MTETTEPNDDLIHAKAQRDKNQEDVDKEFTNLADLKSHVMSGDWTVAEARIHVDGIPYKLMESGPVDWMKVLTKNQPVVVIYSQTHRAWAEEGKRTGLAPWIVVVWRQIEPNVLRPGNVVTTKKHMFSNRVKDTVRESAQPVDKDNHNHIGSTASIKITSLTNSNELKAKIDTGATMSSIHADRWKVTDGSVSFTCKHLSANVITLPLVTHQATKTADGGTENRPVVELNVRINGKIMQSVQFNLNNRAHMEYPVLIGQNILQKGKFLIDPSMVGEAVDDAEIDYESLMEEINSTEVHAEVDSTEVVEQDDAWEDDQILKILSRSEATFKSIIQQARMSGNADDTPEA